MSTCFIFEDAPTVEQFRAAMVAVGINEEVTEDTTEDRFLITDGNAFVWCYIFEWEGQQFVQFETYGMQAVSGGEILDQLAEQLGTVCWCEHDEEFHALLEEEEE